MLDADEAGEANATVQNYPVPEAQCSGTTARVLLIDFVLSDLHTASLALAMAAAVGLAWRRRFPGRNHRTTAPPAGGPWSRRLPGAEKPLTHCACAPGTPPRPSRPSRSLAEGGASVETTLPNGTGLTLRNRPKDCGRVAVLSKQLLSLRFNFFFFVVKLG